MRLSKSIIAGLCMAALVVAAMPASAQRRCQMAEPEVRLELAQEQPSFDTLPLAELRAQSRDGLGEHDQIFGLYKAELRAGLRAQYASRDDGKTGCIAVRAVIIEAQLAERRIYLARELKRGSCRYETTLAHEQRHARIDDALVPREFLVLKQAIARAAMENGVVGPVPVGDMAAHRDDIGERLQRVMRQELERIGEIRRREQGAIDTPEAYRREAARCPGE